MKVIKLTPAEREAIKRKCRLANAKAQATARNAKLFTKYALEKKGWKVASLDSRHGFEYRGVVDLAVKRNNRSGGVVLPARSHVLMTLRTGQRRQDTLDPTKYKYSKRFRDLPEEFTHLVVVVKFSWGEERERQAANNFVLTAYQISRK